MQRSSAVSVTGFRSAFGYRRDTVTGGVEIFVGRPQVLQKTAPSSTGIPQLGQFTGFTSIKLIIQVFDYLIINNLYYYTSHVYVSQSVEGVYMILIWC